MKKLLLLLLIALPIILHAQTKAASTIDKIKSGVRKYLYLTMKDYSSYKPVVWGKVEIIYSTSADENIEVYITDVIGKNKYGAVL